MKNFETIDDILDFAIENEQNAIDFYTELANKSRNEDMRNTFLNFAKEEVNHKAKLVKVKEEKIFTMKSEKIQDLKISDYVDRVLPTPNMSYSEALVVAMKREKAAFLLYTRLADRTENEGLKQLFLTLAQEESKHKLMFEIEYDEVVLREN